MNSLGFSLAALLMLAVQVTFYFAIAYFATRLAIRHERR
jgi:hypothetical protein